MDMGTQMNVSERNGLIDKLVRTRILAVRGQKLDDVRTQLFDELCNTGSSGFREVVLTCAVAWGVGIDFDPSIDFYQCNPRAIFENAIRPVLVQFKLPHKKSGPLNVAKNIKMLNKDWASGRRPQLAATAAVQVLERLIKFRSTDSPQEFRNRTIIVLDVILMYLIAEAEALTALEVVPRTDMSLYCVHELLNQFIVYAADAGNTPQMIVGLVLNQLHLSDGLKLNFEGRACETNLTAKKPADIWLEAPDNKILHLYEVTVKPIDQNRLEDSADSVIAHGRGFNEVVWLCRIPTDIETLNLSKGGIKEWKGVRFEFVDLSQWLLCVLELIGSGGRESLILALNAYVASPNVSKNTKEVWKRLNTE
jgi:hypothetical protein